MLMYLFNALADDYTALNVFRYLTFRGICGVLTALAICLCFGPVMIRKLTKYQIGQTVREDGPSSHFDKRGTPTMGGALIIFAVVLSTLLWSDLSNRFVWVVLLTCVGFGLVGFFDDYRKLVDKNPRGIGARNKFLGADRGWPWRSAVSLHDGRVASGNQSHRPVF